MSLRGLEMKHGDKAKAKSAKAKASGKEARRKKSVAKSSKGAEKSSKAVKAKARAKESARKAPQKSSAPPKGGNGKGSKGARPVSGTVSFSNPVIAEAFRRAVKKYPTAFRRLTDCRRRSLSDRSGSARAASRSERGIRRH